MTCVSGLHPLTRSRHLGSTLTWTAGRDGKTGCFCYCEKMKRALRERGQEKRKFVKEMMAEGIHVPAEQTGYRLQRSCGAQSCEFSAWPLLESFT